MEIFINFGRTLLNNVAGFYSWLVNTSFHIPAILGFDAFDINYLSIFSAGTIAVILAIIVFNAVNPFG